MMGETHHPVNLVSYSDPTKYPSPCSGDMLPPPETTHSVPVAHLQAPLAGAGRGHSAA